MAKISASELYVDFETPLYVIEHYYLTGSIAFLLNLIVVYLIIHHSGKLDTYRFYLLAFQTLFTLFLSGQIEVLTICFLRKHKAIMNLKNTNTNPNKKYFFIYCMCLLYSCSIAISIFVSSESREEQFREIDELYPSLSQKYRDMEEFQYYLNNNRMILYYVLVFGGTIKTAVVVSILVLRMIRALHQIQNQLSARTLSKHKVALRCLVLQFMTTPIAFLPACMLAVVVWFPTRYSQDTLGKHHNWHPTITHSTMPETTVSEKESLPSDIFQFNRLWGRKLNNQEISCIVSDLNISIFIQPIGLFPLPAGYACGIGYRLFFLSSHMLMTLFTLFLSGQIEMLTICFFRKYKAIMNLKNSKKSSDNKYVCIYSMCLLYSCAIAISIFGSSESQEEQLRVLDEFYPSVSQQFRALKEFQYYVYNKIMVIFYVLVFGGTTKTSVIVTILVFRLMKALHQIQNRLSARTISKHRVALRCLILQFMTTPIAFLPACMLAIVVWFPTRYSQVISWFAFMCMTTHSIVNSIVVILTYPEFRKVVMFWKSYSRPQRRSTVVSFIRVSDNVLVH